MILTTLWWCATAAEKRWQWRCLSILELAPLLDLVFPDPKYMYREFPTFRAHRWNGNKSNRNDAPEDRSLTLVLQSNGPSHEPLLRNENHDAEKPADQMKTAQHSVDVPENLDTLKGSTQSPESTPQPQSEDTLEKTEEPEDRKSTLRGALAKLDFWALCIIMLLGTSTPYVLLMNLGTSLHRLFPQDTIHCHHHKTMIIVTTIRTIRPWAGTRLLCCIWCLSAIWYFQYLWRQKKERGYSTCWWCAWNDYGQKNNYGTTPHHSTPYCTTPQSILSNLATPFLYIILERQISPCGYCLKNELESIDTLK